MILFSFHAGTETVKVKKEMFNSVVQSHLTPSEEEWLVKMATSPAKQINLIDNPNKRALNGLVRKGMATCLHDTFWKITDAGVKRCTTIY